MQAGRQAGKAHKGLVGWRGGGASSQKGTQPRLKAKAEIAKEKSWKI